MNTAKLSANNIEYCCKAVCCCKILFAEGD